MPRLPKVKWLVIASDVDGQHLIAKYDTEEQAKKRAKKFLGPNANWLSDTHGVGMFGNVVYVQHGRWGKCNVCGQDGFLYDDGRCDTCNECDLTKEDFKFDKELIFNG